MQFKVIQGHRFWYQSKAHVYDFLLVINTNLPPILHRFPRYTSKIAIFGTPIAFNPPSDGGVPYIISS